MENKKIIEITVKQIVIILIVLIGLTILCIKTKKITAMEISKQELEDKNEIEQNQITETTMSRVKDSEVLTRSAIERKKIVLGIKDKEYKTIQEVTISINMDLTERTGISKEDFKEFVSRVKQDTSKFFYENSDIIYDLCEEYQLNEIFFCGLISAESGWNIASNHRNTYNYISLMANGKLIRYNSVEEGLRVAAQKLHNNYLTEGGCFYYGKTLSAVKTRFCPNSSTWVNLVYGRMEQMIRNI